MIAFECPWYCAFDLFILAIIYIFDTHIYHTRVYLVSGNPPPMYSVCFHTVPHQLAWSIAFLQPMSSNPIIF
jgi:hypothetical protein